MKEKMLNIASKLKTRVKYHEDKADALHASPNKVSAGAYKATYHVACACALGEVVQAIESEFNG